MGWFVKLIKVDRQFSECWIAQLFVNLIRESIYTYRISCRKQRLVHHMS